MPGTIWNGNQQSRQYFGVACLLFVVVPITAADSDLQDSMGSGGGCIGISSLYFAPPVPLLHAKHAGVDMLDQTSLASCIAVVMWWQQHYYT